MELPLSRFRLPAGDQVKDLERRQMIRSGWELDYSTREKTFEKARVAAVAAAFAADRGMGGETKVDCSDPNLTPSAKKHLVIEASVLPGESTTA